MANWFHRFLNPHCEHCLEESREKRICSSCEVLQLEIARLRHDNERLLNSIIEPRVEIERTTAPEPTVPLPTRMPWRVKQQHLEMKDRELAQERKLRAAASRVDVTDLEKELDVISEKREEKSGT